MTLRSENYKCICGGEVTKTSQGGATSRRCNSCDVPTSSLGIRNSIISSYDNVMRVELVRDSDTKTVYRNSFLKKDIQKGLLLDLLNTELDVKLEFCNSGEYTTVKQDTDIYRIYLNGLPLRGEDYILIVDDEIPRSHEYKNSIFDRD